MILFQVYDILWHTMYNVHCTTHLYNFQPLQSSVDLPWCWQTSMNTPINAVSLWGQGHLQGRVQPRHWEDLLYSVQRRLPAHICRKWASILWRGRVDIWLEGGRGLRRNEEIEVRRRKNNYIGSSAQPWSGEVEDKWTRTCTGRGEEKHLHSAVWIDIYLPILSHLFHRFIDICMVMSWVVTSLLRYIWKVFWGASFCELCQHCAQTGRGPLEEEASGGFLENWH